MMDQRAILLMDEQPPTCPTCGRRLSVTDQPVSHDEHGDIYVGLCREHGQWQLQDQPEEPDEEEDDG